MAERKPNKKYYFSVEGETEYWYLKWLQDLVNKTEEAVYKISIDCPVKKNPLKHAKSLTVTRKIEVYHFFDYEGDEEIHGQSFKDTMDNMKKAQLSNVNDAIRRAKKIMQKNEDSGYVLHYYKGYKYYIENPSLAVWEAIEKIMTDCKLA